MVRTRSFATSAAAGLLMISIGCAPASTAPATVPQYPIELTVAAGDARLAATLRFPAAGRAPFPAVVLAHGSGRVTRSQNAPMAERFLAMGLAVLTYDKRGVGDSTGTYVNVGTARSNEVFPRLADDALACLAVLKARPDIDARRIGLAGASQAGWILPLAASRTARAGDVAFLVILSGPAVTVGEEMEYSRLAGADPGSLQGLDDEEIDRRMRAFAGPHGHDPLPVLERLDVPSIWIQGEADRSVPMAQTLAALDRLGKAGRPITVVTLPGADHSLRVPGTGERPDFWPRVAGWLKTIGQVK